MKFILQIFLFASLIFLQPFYSQKLITHFDHLTLRDGLSQATVQKIIQDKNGFIWIATQDGLNKFDGYDFTIYRYDDKNKNSLSYNYLYTLFEDSDGFIWIGTDKGGLNRFDKQSEKFISFTRDKKNRNSIGSFTVRSICEDKDGNLWIGTYEGLSKLDSKYRKASAEYLNNNKNLFYNIYPDPHTQGKLIGSVVNSIICDRKGDLWIGTNKGVQLLELNSNQKTLNFITLKNDSAGFSDYYVNFNALYQDKNGMIWAGTSSGLIKINPADKKIIRVFQDSNNNPQIASLSFNSIIQDSENIFWLGTNKGLIKYNPAKNCVDHITHDQNNPLGLSFNNISSLTEDAGGNIWIGTYGGGINKINAGYQRFKHYVALSDKGKYLANNNIWAIFEDSKNNLWIGTDGIGAIQINKKKKSVQHFTHIKTDTKTISNNRVTSIVEDSFGHIWLGTNDGLNKIDFRKNSAYPEIKRIYLDSKNPSANRIRSIYEDKNKNLWISTWGGGVFKLTAENNANNKEIFLSIKYDKNAASSLSNNYVRPIAELSDQHLWIGTYSGLNICLDKTSDNPQKFINIFSDPGNKKSLSNDGMSSILEDSDNNIWIGTRNGLNKLPAEQRGNITNRNLEFDHIRERDGLANEVIYGMLEDNNNNIWVSSNKGLARVNTRNHNISNYFESDGLQSDEFNVGAHFKNQNGTMYFGGINGYTKFHPDSIKTYNYSPPVYLTKLLVFNKNVGPSDSSILRTNLNFTNQITLDYTDYIFSIEFSALSFRQPKKNKYKYKLEGLHDTWIETDSENRRATFTNLSPGNYYFRVIGSNDEGLWSDKEATLKITLLPPFWLTWWAKIIYVLLFLYGLYSFYAYQKKQYRQKQRELELEKELSEKLEHKVNERTKELKSAKQNAEEANRLKTELLNIAAHDLKNPLNIILGFSSLIKKDLPENSESGEYLESIRKSSDDMLDIITKLLDSSAIETGQLKLETESVNINEIVTSVINEYKNLAINKKQSIFTTFPDSDLYAEADSGRLKEILSNLISNAIKYSPLNSEIQISLYEQNNIAFCEIKDEGPGLSEEEAKLLFGKFQKLSPKPTGGESSTGLGLSIAKQLIELLGGKISFKTKLGQGSSFRVSLPISKIEIKMSNIEPEEIEFYNPKIIVADDLRENRKLIIQLLKKYNITILEADNGYDLIEMANKIKPDLIFCDIFMPEMNGIEAVKIIRKTEKLKNIPVVSITTSNNVEITNAGFDLSLTKPVSRDKLVDVMKKFVDYKIESISDINTPGSSDNDKKLEMELESLSEENVKKLITQITSLKTTMEIEKVQYFAEQLKLFTSEQKMPELTDFSENLINYVTIFDVINIENSLDQLNRLLLKN